MSPDIIRGIASLHMCAPHDLARMRRVCKNWAISLSTASLTCSGGLEVVNIGGTLVHITDDDARARATDVILGSIGVRTKAVVGSVTQQVLDRMANFRLAVVDIRAPDRIVLDTSQWADVTVDCESEIIARKTNAPLPTVRMSISCAGIHHGAKTLDALLNDCTQLKSLTIGGGRMLVGDAHLRVIRTKCTALKILSLNRVCSMDAHSMASTIRACTDLRVLHIHDCFGPADAALAEVASCCTQLEELSIRRVDISDSTMCEVARGCTNLEVLCIDSCTNVSSDSITEVANMCKKLRHVTVANTRNVSRGLVNLVYLCTNLETIAFTNVSPSITSLLTSVRGGTQLTSINIARNPMTTGDVVTSLARAHPALRNLDVSLCTRVTDASIIEVARCCAALESLRVAQCSTLTDASICEIARKCTRIKTIDLSVCTNITDSAVIAIAHNCPRLECIKLDYCTRITNASILEISRCCPRIKEISIFLCHEVTENAIYTAAQRCSQLSRIRAQHARVPKQLTYDLRRIRNGLEFL